MIEHVSEDCSCIGRQCTVCEHLLCFGKFSKHKKGKYGLNSKCRSCNGKENAAWREKNHEYNLQRQRDYHHSHKDEDSARYQAWRQNNLEHDSERHKRYNRENAERLHQQQKEYRRKNRPAIHERERAYWAKHRERKAANVRRSYKLHREKRLARSKIYRQENAERISEQKKVYRLAHREFYTAYLKRWRMKHPLYSQELYRAKREKLGKPVRSLNSKEPTLPRKQLTPEERQEHHRAYWRKYYLKYREHHNQRVREWQKANLRRHAAKEAMRRTRKTQAGGFYTNEEWEDLCEQYNHTCLACRRSGMPLTADHIIPILKGGHSYISNIQPLCKPCNCSKGTKIIDYRLVTP